MDKGGTPFSSAMNHSAMAGYVKIVSRNAGERPSSNHCDLVGRHNFACSGLRDPALDNKQKNEGE